MGTSGLGARGEELAASYLVERGYRILQRNYRYRHLEIDLIAVDGQELVFVEVKARSSFQYGDPEYFVSESKQQKLRQAAEAYVQQQVPDLRTCRFDVVAISERDGEAEVRHLKDAFRGE